MNFASPLRYPGGKTFMTPFFKDFIKCNNLSNVTYAEPYAGGAGAALSLLFSRTVNNIYINDANIAIYSFWNSLINYSEEFMFLFENTDVTLAEWNNQREIFNNAKGFSVSLGFATFYLNRCNRSGIISAGPIGGSSMESQNKAKYKIDARFKKKNLRIRLQRIIENKEYIHVSNKDALNFVNDLDKLANIKELFVYLDPPYYVHGSELYMNFYRHQDHQNLCSFLKQKHSFHWILSYDNVSEIKKMYKDFTLYTFDLKYTINKARRGKELLVYSESKSVLPEKMEIRRVRSNNIEIYQLDN